MKNDNKTINGLINALETARYHKGNFGELEPVLRSVSSIVDNFNKIHDIDPAVENVKAWAEELKEEGRMAKEAGKAMNQEDIPYHKRHL